ncbi:MAG TPA: hypothetical protein PL134_02945 [Smithellaceae bacterium]|nr:hypothetical protein [Smithellaceae bacterium]HNT92016.1 hypothetical protein [Smithellaceae bacterium]HNV64589.1 hypothetical protein [Smithellaceae bacterium]HNZ31829.1 hypothetical protein [Smithellaceae bacterium]HOF76897.1 hypothetical protein [Smithellaceae bacterium]
MIKKYMGVNMKHSQNQWAEAIATRLSDEWDGKLFFPEDAELLKEVLTTALKAVPGECKRLIGTGIIEESYFEICS